MTQGISRKKMQSLFDLLKQIEEQDLALSARDLEQRVTAGTGYAQETWATYRAKYLDDALIVPDDADPVLLRVRGARAMSPQQFAGLMTQSKRHASLHTLNEAGWREQLRALAELGRAKRFMMPSEDRNLLLSLFDRQRRLF